MATRRQRNVYRMLGYCIRGIVSDTPGRKVASEAESPFGRLVSGELARFSVGKVVTVSQSVTSRLAIHNRPTAFHEAVSSSISIIVRSNGQCCPGYVIAGNGANGGKAR